MDRRRFLALLPALTLAADADAELPPALFVVHPYHTPSVLYTRFRPLTLHLSKTLGRPLGLLIAPTYERAVDMIASGQADFAYLGPTPYLQARDKSPIRILAGETENGQAFYQSVLVVRADSPIQRVADLAGKRLALGNEISMASSVAPKLILARAGIGRTDLAEVAHLDRHERCALAVLHGDYDVGGLRLDIAKSYLPRGLRILATSQPLPPHVVVAADKVPDEQVALARQALLAPTPAGAEAIRALGPGIGFVAIDDSQLLPTRRFLKLLESW